jgi:hypothetical protein
MQAKEVKRVAIPLVMIEGNMDILLENTIPCAGVSLSWYPAEVPGFSGQGVVLHVHNVDHTVAGQLGFQMTSVSEVSQ